VLCRGSRLLLASALVLASAAAATAQTPRVEGPFSGLFGGQSRNRNVRQSLDVRGSVFGVHQEVLRPSAASLRELDPRFQRSGTFGAVSGAASYSYQRSARRASFLLGGNATAASYSTRPDLVMASYNGVSGINANLTRKITLSTTAFGSYAPFYNFGSGAAPPPTFGNSPLLVQGSLPGGGGFDQTLPGSNFGFNAVFLPNTTYGGSVGLTGNVSTRTTLSAIGDYRDFKFIDSGSPGFRTLGGMATVRHSLTRRVALRFGYGRFASTTYGAAQSQRLSRDNYEAGLDYADLLRLQLGRTTTLAFAPNAAVMHWNGRTQFRLNGSASLTHGMGRTWSASAGYIRDTGFVIGFQQPVLTDSAVGSLGGMVGDRVRWTTTGSWMRGQIGFDSPTSFSWTSATSGLSVALGRSIALFGQYGYYAFNVPPGAFSLTTVPQFARQTVSVGLSVFAPIFSSSGRVRP
jgi:hypothetical protein